MILKNNGNRTKWRPIRSVIIRVITQSEDHMEFDLLIASN